MQKTPFCFNGHNHHPLISYLLLIYLQIGRWTPRSDQESSLEWVHRESQMWPPLLPCPVWRCVTAPGSLCFSVCKQQALTFPFAHKDFSCGPQSVLDLSSLVQGLEFSWSRNMLFYYLQQKKNYLNTSKINNKSQKSHCYSKHIWKPQSQQRTHHALMMSTGVSGQMSYLIQNFLSLLMLLGKSPSLTLFLNRSVSPLIRLPTSGVRCWSLAVT